MMIWGIGIVGLLVIGELQGIFVEYVMLYEGGVQGIGYFMGLQFENLGGNVIFVENREKCWLLIDVNFVFFIECDVLLF